MNKRSETQVEIFAFPGLKIGTSTPATWTCRWGPRKTWGTHVGADWGFCKMTLMGFVLSHPFARKKAKGWGTERYMNKRSEAQLRFLLSHPSGAWMGHP
jgi:hypothetical protein